MKNLISLSIDDFCTCYPEYILIGDLVITRDVPIEISVYVLEMLFNNTMKKNDIVKLVQDVYNGEWKPFRYPNLGELDQRISEYLYTGIDNGRPDYKIIKYSKNTYTVSSVRACSDDALVYIVSQQRELLVNIFTKYFNMITDSAAAVRIMHPQYNRIMIPIELIREAIEIMKIPRQINLAYMNIHLTQYLFNGDADKCHIFYNAHVLSDFFIAFSCQPREIVKMTEFMFLKHNRYGVLRYSDNFPFCELFDAGSLSITKNFINISKIKSNMNQMVINNEKYNFS